MNQKEKNQFIAVGVIMCLSIAGLIGLGVIQFTPNGITFNYPTFPFIPQGNVGDNNGNDNGVPPTTPPTTSNTYITLTVTPEISYRTDTLTVTVDSDVPNGNSLLTVTHDFDDSFEATAPIMLDANGDYTTTMPADHSGWWRSVATVNTLTSNVEYTTINGITIHQYKNEWSVGEQYTAATTSTYRDWYVIIMYKNHTDTVWLPYTVALTNINGIIHYGDYTSDTIDAANVGLELDVIAIIDSSDPDGYDHLEQFLEETQFMPSQSDIDQAVASGDLVKSNILTFRTVP